MSSEIATETRPTQKPLTVPLCLLNSFLSTTKHIQTPLEKFGRWVPIEIIIFIKLENIMSLYVYSSLTHLPPGKHHNWCPPPDFSHTIDPTHMILWFQWVPFHRSDSKLFPSAPAGVSLSLSPSFALGPPTNPPIFPTTFGKDVDVIEQSISTPPFELVLLQLSLAKPFFLYFSVFHIV
jgi:hypothetical protein